MCSALKDDFRPQILQDKSHYCFMLTSLGSAQVVFNLLMNSGKATIRSDFVQTKPCTTADIISVAPSKVAIDPKTNVVDSSDGCGVSSHCVHIRPAQLSTFRSNEGSVLRGHGYIHDWACALPTDGKSCVIGLALLLIQNEGGHGSVDVERIVNPSSVFPVKKRLA